MLSRRGIDLLFSLNGKNSDHGTMIHRIQRCYNASLRLGAGIWKEMRKGTGESLSPLNEHRHDHVHVVFVAHGLEHARAGGSGDL